MKIPEKYVGVILSSSEQKLPKEALASAEGEPEDDDQPDDVGVLMEHAQFDEFMVWGHEVLPDEKQDPYIRAVSEWISLAEAVCFLLPCRMSCVPIVCRFMPIPRQTRHVRAGRRNSCWIPNILSSIARRWYISLEIHLRFLAFVLP